MANENEFVATPTMWDFMNDPAFVRLIAGSVGSGKSVACCHEIIKLAIQQKPNKDGIRKSRTAIVRNTLDQLRSTTMKTFMDWFGSWGYYKASEKTFFIDIALPDGTRVQTEIFFLPLDDPNDVRKALSLELTFLWGNEWRELHPQVIDGLLMRLRRFPSKKDGGPSRSCALFDSNMPDADTWHFNQMEEPPENWSIFIQPPAVLSEEEWIATYDDAPDPADGVFGKDESGGDIMLWVNPDADNINNLDPAYYPDIIPGKTPDFINVYLRCRYGRSLFGVPVYEKTFNPGFHVAEKPFSALRSENYPLIVGLDFGRTPAATITQRNVSGQLVLLAEVDSENMGIETFLRTKLTPILSSSDFIGCNVLVAPDPAGWQKQQIGEVSPVDVLKSAGYTVVKPNTNDPARRIEAVERVLLRHMDGKPAMVVNPCCESRIKGFRYGYKYELNRKGQQSPKPLKDKFSHGADSVQYAVLVAENTQAGGSVVRSRREIRVTSAAGWT